MKKLNKLTEEQKSQFKSWVDKWVKIGLKTGETDWETFGKNIEICYKKANKKFPKKIIKVQSPMVGAFAAAIANHILSDGAVRDAVTGAVAGAVDVAVGVAVGGAVDGAVRDAVYDAVGGAVRDAVYDAVGGAVGVAVGGAVDGAVRDAVYDAVGVAVGDAVGVAVGGAVGGAVDGAVRDAVYDAVGVAVGGAVDDAVLGAVKKIAWHNWLGGQFCVGGWWGSPSFVSFFTDICGLELSADIKERQIAYRKICESVNYFWCNANFVMVCARPTKISLNSKGQLHCDGAKAIEYPDGWGLYMLNGVKVPEYLAITQESQLDIEWYLQQKNADVKAEFVRKYGVERMLSFGKQIDSWKNHKEHEFYTNMWEASNYELWDMAILFEGLSYVPYLKMKNQTTGIWHVEAVSPECRKLPEALKERMGGTLRKIIAIK